MIAHLDGKTLCASMRLDPVTKTYTLTQNVELEIGSIVDDDVTIETDGYTLHGSLSRTGAYAMKYDEISPAVRAYIGTHQVFRQLGFSAECLNIMTARSVKHGGLLSLFCVLKTQGKSFSVELGAIEQVGVAYKKTELLVLEEYRRVALAISSVSEDDMRRIMEESEAFREKVSMLMALMNKGIVLPNSEIA